MPPSVPLSRGLALLTRRSPSPYGPALSQARAFRGRGDMVRARSSAVERVTFNHEVLGSIPSGLTRIQILDDEGPERTYRLSGHGPIPTPGSELGLHTKD